MRDVERDWTVAALWIELKRVADSDEDATKIIQAAYDFGLYELPPGTYRVSGLIQASLRRVGRWGGGVAEFVKDGSPPVVEKPLHAYFPSDVNAGSRSPCVHCGQAYDAHVPPPVVENPAA